MAWVRFTTSYCWTATPAVNIVFKPDGGKLKDGRYLVTRDCASKAIEAGAAVKAARPVGRV